MRCRALFAALTGLTITNGLLPLASHAQHKHDAYKLIRDKQCISGIHTVHSDIENRLGGSVLQVRYEDPSLSQNRARSPVPNRQMEITFNLLARHSRTATRRAPLTQNEENANISLANSPALVKNYAEQIIQSCRNVGSVSVWMWEKGVGWSVNSEMQLVQKRCIDYDTWQRRGLTWGEDLCV